ncbi:hypothetical protein C2S51_009812 [Perilla frutescens var. frutescens]|nr:hypothetical protein C2S51_009812 [Perilla frutescens var. frutescens]
MGMLAEYAVFDGDAHAHAAQCFIKLSDHADCNDMISYKLHNHTLQLHLDLNKEFGPKLKKHMKYCVKHSDEISKDEKLKALGYQS